MTAPRARKRTRSVEHCRIGRAYGHPDSCACGLPWPCPKAKTPGPAAPAPKGIPAPLDSLVRMIQSDPRLVNWRAVAHKFASRVSDYFAGPPDETCEWCGADPRNVVHADGELTRQLASVVGDTTARMMTMPRVVAAGTGGGTGYLPPAPASSPPSIEGLKGAWEQITKTHLRQAPVDSLLQFVQREGAVYEAIESLRLDWHLGNAVKFIARAGRRAGTEDLVKAIWCLERELAGRRGDK